MYTQLFEKYRAYVVLAVVLAAGIGGFWFFSNTGTNPLQDVSNIATTTDSTEGNPADSSAKPKSDFTKYPEHTLPAGAKSIDQYVYVYQDSVYLNSVAGKSSSVLPEADADTFARISDFMTSPDSTININCGGSGSFAYYADRKRVFFYQIWLTPKFKKSKMELMIGVSPENFSIINSTSFRDGEKTYRVSYETATSSCQYILKQYSLLPV